MSFLKNIESELWLLANSKEPEDRREWAVLYWKYHGLTHQQVADKLHYGKDWVQRYMTSAHRRFGTPDGLESLERFEWLQENVFPALKKFLEDNPDTLKELPPPPDEPFPPPPPPDPRGIKPYVQEPIIIKGKRPPRRGRLVLAVMGVLLVLVGGASYWLGTRNNPPVAPVNASEPPQSVLSPTLPLPSPSLESTLTFTPEATFTPTTPPTATTNPFLFSDNFNDGLDPAWTTIFGDPIVVNGQLTASESTMVSVGDASWTDYQVSFDIDMPLSACRLGDLSNAVGVRASSVDSMLILVFSGCHSQWNNVVGGAWNPIAATYIDSFFAGDSKHITIDVKGNQISVHFNADLISSLVSDDYPSGYVFIKIRPETLYDDFRVTLLD